MDIRRRKDRVVFILILILAFLFGRNVIYRNNLSNAASIEAQLEEETKKNEILKTIEILDQKLQAYQKRSFSAAETTQLLDRVSELAKQSGIEVETFNPLPAVEREHYIELPLKLSISCNYHKLGVFLAMLESTQEFIWAKELQMLKSSVTAGRIRKATEKVMPKIDLTISGIYLKEGE